MYPPTVKATVDGFPRRTVPKMISNRPSVAIPYLAQRWLPAGEPLVESC